jgi:hypothetical protein
MAAADNGVPNPPVVTRRNVPALNGSFTLQAFSAKPVAGRPVENIACLAKNLSSMSRLRDRFCAMRCGGFGGKKAHCNVEQST